MLLNNPSRQDEFIFVAYFIHNDNSKCMTSSSPRKKIAKKHLNERRRDKIYYIIKIISINVILKYVLERQRIIH